MKTQKQADLGLLLITIFWGLANVVSSVAVRDLSSLQMNAIRFTIAFLVSYAFFFKKMRHISRETLKASLVIGLLLAGVYVTCMEAFLRTDVTNVGFLLSLHVVIVPAYNFFVRKIVPGKKLLLCIVLATVGLGFLTLGGASMKIRMGDILAILSAIFYTADMILTDDYVENDAVDPLQLGILQLGVCAAIFLVWALISGESLRVTGLRSWACILYLSLFATAAAFIVQTVAQSKTDVNRVGLIFSCEPAFTSIAAFLIVGERLSAGAYLGAVLMFLSLILMNVEFPVRSRQ